MGFSATAYSAWEVLVLFVIPVGAGIPGGVLLAKTRGLPWPLTAFLYFISDVILAFTFEPIMKGFIALGRKFALLGRALAAMGRMTQRTVASYGSKGGPITLILIAFGVDPMTGRAAAAAAGHGFVAGWMFAITGDMLFFALIMVSTLWLNSIIGDPNKVMAVILVGMFVFPALISRWRGKKVESEL
jgi:hypothetical protein